MPKARNKGMFSALTRCPSCSSRDTVRIVYGDATARRRIEAASGRVLLGGSPNDPERPNRYCNACGSRWETALSRALRDVGSPGG